jgi:hypothetical protein
MKSSPGATCAEVELDPEREYQKLRATCAAVNNQISQAQQEHK